VTGLDVPALLAALGICAQIFVVDLLLSADNALVIAMAGRALPPADMRRAALLGTAGAIALRVAMAGVVVFMLQIPFLKIVAGVTLLVIAVRLAVPRAAGAAALPGGGGADMLGAVVTIILADAVMSLDNVVAVAALAQGSLVLMGIGLAMSIPMLIQGSALIRAFLDRNGAVVTLGGMFLGWVAGQIGVADPLVAGWVAVSAPALAVAVPAACAVFVLWESRILAGAALPVPAEDCHVR
jgi:YjbE family integral membrane protein